MYKVIVLFVCFLFGTEIFSDEFEDYIHSCTYLSKNFKRAAAAPESRAGTEYRMHLKTAKNQAEKIQLTIRRLNLGTDFDFPALTVEVEKIYSESLRNKGKRKSQNNLLSWSENPDGIFSILLFDVKNLRKMDFTTEDDGNIKSEIATKRRIYEYERCFQFFQLGKKKYLSAKGKEDPSFCRFFVLRCRHFAALAESLTMQIQDNNPQGYSEINLKNETVSMLSAFQKIAEYNAKPQRHKAEHRRSGSLRSSKKRSDKKGKKVAQPQDSIENLNSDMQINYRNIAGVIRKLKYSNFVTDPPLAGGKTMNVSDDPADILKGSGTKPNYEGMDEAALMKLLREHRKTIIKGNTSMDGFDSQSEKRYLKTLTSDQKKLFNKYLKEDLNLGYEREIAVRNVLLRINSEIQMSKKIPSKKELVRILENIDKDKESQNKKVKVSF